MAVVIVLIDGKANLKSHPPSMSSVWSAAAQFWLSYAALKTETAE